MSTALNYPAGKWIIVRSDRHVVSVDKPDYAYVLGRERHLPPAQLLSHKYTSREHLVVIWHPPHLCIIQKGKNPSFIGPRCIPVPPPCADAALSPAEIVQPPQPQARLRFAAMSSAHEATEHLSAGDVMTVEVPVSDALTVMEAPDRRSIDAATVYFPEELGLPTLSIRFEGADAATRVDATAAVTSKTTAEMLAVPSARKLGDHDDDEESSSGESKAGICSSLRVEESEGASDGAGGGKPIWRGLLDMALQRQQHRLHETVHAPPTTRGRDPRSAPEQVSAEPAPTAGLPSNRASKLTTTPAPATADPLPPETGRWEWRCDPKGTEHDTTSWTKFCPAVEELLEKAYKDPSIVKIKIPDSLMFGKPNVTRCTYGVCFAEKALDGAMVRYSLQNPSDFCVVRRTGGPAVNRKGAKRAHVLPTPSSSEQDESEAEESVSDSSGSEDSMSSSPSSTSSSASSSCSSSDSSGVPQGKRPRRH